MDNNSNKFCISKKIFFFGFFIFLFIFYVILSSLVINSKNISQSKAAVTCSPVCAGNATCKFIKTINKYRCVATFPISSFPRRLLPTKILSLTPTRIISLTPIKLLSPTSFISPTPASSCSVNIADLCKKWGADGCIVPAGGIDTCITKVGTTTHYYYSQKDPRWADAPVWANSTIQCTRKDYDGNSVPLTFQVNVCALTIALTLLSEYVNPATWNPMNFTNKYTPINHCYGISIDEGLKLLTENGFTVGTPVDNFRDAKDFFKKGWKIIWVTMVVNDPKLQGGHHSLIVGIDSNDNFIFNDPYFDFGAKTTFTGDDYVHWNPIKFYPINPPIK